MTLIIDFAPEEEARLRDRAAAAAGKDLGAFIREAALEKASQPTLAEILSPVHEASRESSVSVEEIDAAADRAREELRRERRGARWK